MKDAVHAGRMAIFKHPMNFKESCLPPCVGDGAYTEEEQAWWNGTLSYLVANLDVDVDRKASAHKAVRGFFDCA